MHTDVLLIHVNRSVIAIKSLIFMRNLMGKTKMDCNGLYEL